MYKKKKILDVDDVYTANAFQNEEGFFIGSGSETKDEVYFYDMANGEVSPILRQPGGMKSFIPIPGKPYLFVSIMGMYPPFDGKGAGLYLHSRMETNWESGMAFPLPYAVCCETILASGTPYLVASTLSKHMDNPVDWSNPGEIHVINLDFCEYKKWKSEIIDDSIIRNHGMFKGMFEGKEVIYVSGEQGIFYISKEAEGWSLNQVFFTEVSEMCFADLDGDGKDELVTIEPFHGNTVNIYKKDGANWNKKFSAELSDGHGLSAGTFNGEPTVVAGNRSGSLSLEAFVVQDLMAGKLERREIDVEAGPTQTRIFSFDSTDYIMSANQKKNEVALYS